MTIETFKVVDGRRVIASDSAEAIGTVKGFVLDGRGRKIEAIHVDGRGKRALLLDWSSVSAFGADAVMASAATDPSSIGDDHQLAAVKGSIAMLGARVLTVDGHEVGRVADVEFDTGSGEVVRVVTDHGSIEVARLRALGSYALVVDEDRSSSPT